MVKSLVLGPILAHLVQIQATIFFSSKIWLCQSLDIIVSYHHVLYQKKTNDPILRILSHKWTDTDGEIDRQAGRQTDRHNHTNKSDFIGCCPTNAKHPKKVSVNSTGHNLIASFL